MTTGPCLINLLPTIKIYECVNYLVVYILNQFFAGRLTIWTQNIITLICEDKTDKKKNSQQS